MKILALEHEIENPARKLSRRPERPELADEAACLWEMYRRGILREFYFRNDRDEAVLVLECEDAAAAESILNFLPLVRNGLIQFDIIPLRPYPGFARLFGEPVQTDRRRLRQPKR